MNWLMLYTAIAFEVVGTTSLKLSEGMTRLGWFALCLALYATSFALLAISLKTIPVGVAYAIWSGAGTVLIALIGILWFHEAASPLRLLFIAMILIGAIGLNLTTRSQ
jgi:small multidrug resistance pump